LAVGPARRSEREGRPLKKIPAGNVLEHPESLIVFVSLHDTESSMVLNKTTFLYNILLFLLRATRYDTIEPSGRVGKMKHGIGYRLSWQRLMLLMWRGRRSHFW